MAIGNPLMGTWRKKLGDVVFYRRKGEQVARARNRKPLNPQTDKQLIQRSRLKPLVAMHRVLDGVAHGVLRIGETQYNGFIKQNMLETRPEYLDAVTPAVYPGVYPKLVPPMPRIALGYGLPVLMPYIVTIGRFPEPLYGLADSSHGAPTFGTNITGGSSGIPIFYFPRSYFTQAVIFLQNYGIDISADSGSVTLDPFIAEHFINYIVTGYDNIHTGLLIAYYGASEYRVERAVYAEIGNILESSLQITWSTTAGVKQISGITGNIVNSDGDEFSVNTQYANDFEVYLTNHVELPSLGNASSVILSRRVGGALEVSTSRMLLSQNDAQAAYLSLFSPEVEEAAIIDYTKNQSENDGLNLGLVE